MLLHTPRGLLLLSAIGLAKAFEADIISDLVTTKADERKALQIKQEEFWQLIRKSASQSNVDEHRRVYADVEEALSSSPPENEHVNGLLEEALMRLRRADETVLGQAVESAALADDRLQAGPAPDSIFSFLTGGQNFLSFAIRQFVGGGNYVDRVAREVSNRQSEVLPALRGAFSATGDVLSDCRLATKLGFDVLQYDIYNKDVPKTPTATKAAASKLIEAAGQTRHGFMQGVNGMANAIARDTQEKSVSAPAKIIQSYLGDLNTVGFGSTTVGEEPDAIQLVREDKVSISF